MLQWIVVVVAQIYEYAKSRWIVHLQWAKCMRCMLYLNKAVFKKRQVIIFKIRWCRKIHNEQDIKILKIQYYWFFLLLHAPLWLGGALSWARRQSRWSVRLENRSLGLDVWLTQESKKWKGRLVKIEWQLILLMLFSVLWVETTVLCLGKDSSQYIKHSDKREWYIQALMMVLQIP